MSLSPGDLFTISHGLLAMAEAMTGLEAALTLLVALGLLLAFLQAVAQRVLIRAPRPPVPAALPPVSILRPLKGVDADLTENLRSLFRQAYREFEIILGTEEPDDPALVAARRVAREFPRVRCVILGSAPAIGFNPKVNNLASLASRARHPLLLISDSNIRVPADHLENLAAHRAQAGGGLVWSLVRGVNGRGLGGILESLQLNGPMMGGVSALARILKIPCAVGKSMLIHRDDLNAIGGFRFLGQFLAEDQICAEELARRGRPVVVAGSVIDNVLGRRTLREFASRHLRWARLRRHVSPTGYCGEILLNPTFLALLGLVAFRSADFAIVAGLALVAMSLINASTERLLGLRRPVWVYPPLELALSLVRGVLWFVALFTRTVVWRGKALRLTARSRIDFGTPVADRGLMSFGAPGPASRRHSARA
jgi:ceramide glucosyltransferase